VPSSEIVAAALVALSTLALLYWRSGKSSTVYVLPYAQTRRGLEVDPLLAPIEPAYPIARLHRVVAILAASIACKGEHTDTEEMLGIADEFLQYLEGNDAVMPRPDTLTKGRIPR
jgi:hypothetical protein